MKSEIHSLRAARLEGSLRKGGGRRFAIRNPGARSGRTRFNGLIKRGGAATVRAGVAAESGGDTPRLVYHCVASFDAGHFEAGGKECAAHNRRGPGARLSSRRVPSGERLVRKACFLPSCLSETVFKAIQKSTTIWSDSQLNLNKGALGPARSQEPLLILLLVLVLVVVANRRQLQHHAGVSKQRTSLVGQ